MRDELIAKIRALQDELQTRGVRREGLNFRSRSDEELEEILESVGEQLAARKRFLGEK